MSGTNSAAPAAHTYAVIGSGGVVVDVLVTTHSVAGAFPASVTVVDVTSVTPQPVRGWTYTGAVFVAPAPVVPPPVTLTPLMFMALLTPAEETAIATAALQNASVLLWLVKTSGASYVSLGDPATIAGVDAMVAAGLITAARAAQILANQAPPAAASTTAASTGSTAS